MPKETDIRVRVVDVVVDPKLGGIDSIWTYRATVDVNRGDAVFVQLGARPVVGFVVNAREANEGSLGFPVSHLKTIVDKVEGLSLPAELLNLIDYMAEQYVCPLSLALAAATPSGVREQLVTAWKLEDRAEGAILPPLQREVVKMLGEQGGVLLQRPSSRPAPSTMRALKSLRGKGLVRQTLSLNALEPKKDAQPMLRLTVDLARLDTFLQKEGKRRPAQAITIMRLQTGDPAPLTASEIKALSGITDSTLKAMVESGLLERVEPESLHSKAPPTPNGPQREAILRIINAVDANRHEAFLLYGVTGSGKTEVYLRAADAALKSGRQVLYLVPEIALATQAITQLRERFGSSVALIHSELSAREKLETWARIREGKAAVVLGARSALFAPLTRLGLIVVDEEHETSYKQESVPRYHAKRLALFLGRAHKAPVVLGSATPSIESFHEAESQELTLLELPHRTASSQLPSVEVVDLAEGFRTGKPAIVGPRLFSCIEETLHRSEQCILFLNRRAYAPFLICRDCGHQFRCPRCAVSLAYSRSEKKLRCHHCGYRQFPPEHCPSCGGNRLNPFGIGTEKVEETVSELFPASRIARLDRDVAQKRGALEDVLARFRSGDIDILVGTQMVAKGLDFPNVTLVGVIAADISLNVPDFRSTERTFQLLSQVAGRAGRGVNPGHVVMQTFNPGNVAIASAKSHDYAAFYHVVKEDRSLAAYPPFARLVNIVFSGESHEAIHRASLEAAERLQALDEAIILGPTECALERLHGKWRMHLLIKLTPGDDISKTAAHLKPLTFKDVNMIVDVDPYSMV